MRRPVSLPYGESLTSVDIDAENRHDLHAALFGLEASADGLWRRLADGADDVRELSAAVLLEIKRVRHLVHGTSAPTSTFELADAIAPVMTSARSTGQSLISIVPPGLRVVGDAGDAARMLLGLLDNARRHAPTSTVTVSAVTAEHVVSLLVDDDGPGLTPDRDIFGRGERGPGSDGDGLGLFIARRLMERHGGSLIARRDAGRGASFVATFERAT